MLEYRCHYCGKVLRDEEGIRTELGTGTRILPWLFEEPRGFDARLRMVDLCPACHSQLLRYRRIKHWLAFAFFVVVFVGIYFLYRSQMEARGL